LLVGEGRFFESPRRSFLFGLGATAHIGTNCHEVEVAGRYKRSIDLGFGRAMASYGLCCELRRGVLRSYSEALKYYRMGAAQNDLPSNYNLSILFLEGVGVQKISNELLRLLKLSADLGEPRALRSLGLALFQSGLFNQIKWKVFCC
jgi:TPR repeat protein